ncbi:hypothetical protein GCM10011583_64360 [Streptomyces camponoticapitis]|uniref:ATP-binding protein n=2 Tax=Streptomyces camponoticapitis TaxID=1616125 RepID=A0ABQ2ERY5_9ACTN|nr:hypothetical protein GCM10011583_64360 [Streptomyces camponoticapitis]
MRIPVQVMPDFLENVARRNDPLGAVEVDADATNVSVDLEINEFEAVDAVVITDDGLGIPSESVTAAFSGIGGSWKRGAPGTLQQGRQLHGRHGYGRFRVLALGSTASWTTVADGTAGARDRSAVRFTDGATEFEHEGPQPDVGQTGTVVRVIGEAPRKNRLTIGAVRDDMTRRFAMYLMKYPGVTVSWQGEALDPEEAIDRRHEVPLILQGFEGQGPVLRVIEWKTKPTNRELLICDGDGVHRITLKAGVPAPDFHYSAYLLWDKFAHITEHNLLEGEFEHHDTPLGLAVMAAREELRAYFHERERERTRDQVQRWIREGVYPYAGEPTSETAAAERETFDEVAVLIRKRLKGTKETQRTQLVLLREALRRQPAAMPRVLDELFQLSSSDKERLETLVRQTPLSNLIAANALVLDRIDFLALLKKLLFEPESRQDLREKDQLHRMLEKELWVFGDEYTGAASEIGLTEACDRHLALLQPKVPRARKPIRRANGLAGRLDLMLSCAAGADSTKRHLVVELKRPTVRLGETEAQQIRSYARAVTQDERFRHDKTTRWVFWLVGNSIDTDLAWAMSSNRLPENCLQDDGQTSIWVYDWGQMIDLCEQRLAKHKERLDYASGQRHMTNYAERVHSDADVISLLPPA